ncbi:MAG: hypothetical protein ACREMR_04495 [Gemmatimonadales bacterium]
MSAPQKGPSSQSLQFDRAEASGPTVGTGAMCTACNRTIADSYFEINGKVVCPTCRSRLAAQWNRGSSGARFSKALVLGLLAGAVGAGIWFALLKLFNIELGLVAIVVGLLVGGAVRKGSQGRGGWAYQALAMFITYGAIVSTYIPFLIEGMRDGAVVQDSAATTPATAVKLVGDSISLAADSAGPVLAAVTAPGDSVAATVRSAGVLGVAIGLVLLFALAFATPVLLGFQNIIGMVIIAIALYEAWKMNKRAELAVTGPYRVAAGGTPA